MLVEFVRLQALACSFAFTLVGLLVATRYVGVPHVPRYDLLFLLCLGIQAWLLRIGFETPKEGLVIGTFHLVGVLLEWHKVRTGSWSYPEFAYLKINGVPLYSGFMYASVASYMMAAWRLLDLRFNGWPKPVWVALSMGVVYAQFFVPGQALWVRVVVFLALAVVFSRCWVSFRLSELTLAMPSVLALCLIGVFVWLAENLATFFGAWTYPHQTHGWQPVHMSKVLSWTMLMVVSLAVIQMYKSALRMKWERSNVTRARSSASLSTET